MSMDRISIEVEIDGKKYKGDIVDAWANRWFVNALRTAIRNGKDPIAALAFLAGSGVTKGAQEYTTAGSWHELIGPSAT